MKREIKFHPAYDKRSPKPGENYGVHGMEMCFYLRGEEGVLQFVLYTNWHLKPVQEEFDKRIDVPFPHLHCHPQPADIGYHSKKPMYAGQTMLLEDCHLLGGPCYYDGSTLNAEPFYWTLVEHGEDALWAKMEEWYAKYFEKDEAGGLR